MKILFQKDPSLKVATVAKKLKMTRRYANKIKVNSLNIRARTKKPGPKHSEGQILRINNNLPKLCRKFAKKIVILDDETYVPINPEEISGREFYHSKNQDNVLPKHKYKSNSKFSKKFMIWQEIDTLGNVSAPIFVKDI